MRTLRLFLGALLLRLSSSDSGSKIPYNTPFQIVAPSADHKTMSVNKEGLAKLQAQDVPISLLSVVGPYHSGKSFLLNSLLESMKAFVVGSKTTPETLGIWLCRTSHKASDGSEVWLMDSEGFFSPGVDEGYDAKVFTVASLLGSHLVYNTVKIIDQQAVNLLEILLTQAQLFSSRSSVRATGPVPEFLKVESFPPLTWVVEDFVQELPDEFQKDGPIGHLTTYLESSGSASQAVGKRSNDNATQETIITKTFRDVRVAHLFLPATTKEQLQDLSKLEWSHLTKEYQSEVQTLRAHVLRHIKSRMIDGKKATGPKLAQALKFTITALEQGMFQELPSLWTSWTAQVAQMALKDGDEWFSALLQELDRAEDPVPLAVFNGAVETAREKASAFYRNLIKDFNVRPQMGELRQRMDRHFDRKLQTYHERTRRWVNELLTQRRDSFAQSMTSLALPMDPAALEKQGKATADVLTQNFTTMIADFSKSGRAVTLGSAAQMPTFGQTPATQLANDFRAQLSARSLENDREVDRVFKAASQAATAAVDQELRSVGENLLGKARMEQVFKSAELACWRSFDEKLGATQWAVDIPKYKVAKTQVRKEALEAKRARFSAAHDKKLDSHLHTGLQSAKATFKEKAQAGVSMPATQTDIDAQHSQVAVSTLEGLSDFARTLTDTDAFQQVERKLKEFMEEGRKQLQEKNVELWKVYSDGATRCAAEANEKRSRDCGWLCLFTSVPWWHRRISQTNLQACFTKDAISARMTPQLQAQVFEVWYAKDMAKASSRVWRNLGIYVVTAAIASLAIWWFCGGKAWLYYRFFGYYPVQGNSFYQPQVNSRPMWTGATSYAGQQPCFAGQQVYYNQQAGQPQFAPAMNQRRGLFGA